MPLTCQFGYSPVENGIFTNLISDLSPPPCMKPCYMPLTAPTQIKILPPNNIERKPKTSKIRLTLDE